MLALSFSPLVLLRQRQSHNSCLHLVQAGLKDESQALLEHFPGPLTPSVPRDKVYLALHIPLNVLSWKSICKDGLVMLSQDLGSCKCALVPI